MIREDVVAQTSFDPMLGVHYRPSDHHFVYDSGVFGPEPELRRLDSIRRSLRDPNCDGPDPVYSIVMDVGREKHRDELHRRMLLFGVVAYASGRLGDEPVRSQGHVHAIASHCGWSTPEIFEIWEGRAIIYAQEFAQDEPGRCFAVSAGPGEQVIVPPKWAHYVVNADPASALIFGAWCDRQYGFVYDEVGARGGLAWFPVLNADSSIHWEANPKYRPAQLIVRGPRTYHEFDLDPQVPIYEQFARNPESVQWVSEPARKQHLWAEFVP